MKIRLALLSLLTLTACDPARLFEIRAGGHDSGRRASAFTGDSLHFLATFDETAVYETRDPANQGDINKLMGFSDCGSHHHENSARFGWRWFDGELQIHAYIYVDGERRSQLLGAVRFDVAVEYLIEIDGGNYRFTLDGETTVMARGCSGGGGVKYRLYPYFGGDEEAPQDIHIAIERL